MKEKKHKGLNIRGPATNALDDIRKKLELPDPCEDENTTTDNEGT